MKRRPFSMIDDNVNARIGRAGIGRNDPDMIARSLGGGKGTLLRPLYRGNPQEAWYINGPPCEELDYKEDLAERLRMYACQQSKYETVPFEAFIKWILGR